MSTYHPSISHYLKDDDLSGETVYHQRWRKYMITIASIFGSLIYARSQLNILHTENNFDNEHLHGSFRASSQVHTSVNKPDPNLMIEHMKRISP
jgi:hypothetical protein